MAVHDNQGDHCLAVAAMLNRDCLCDTLSEQTLLSALESERAWKGVSRVAAQERPHLLAKTQYFVSRRQIERMREIVRAVESIVALPAYRERVLASAPPIAQFEPGPLGAFFGYDFHLQGEDPKLIEISTNAGGALLNTALARAQRARVKVAGRQPFLRDTTTGVEQGFVDMFRAEWRRQRGNVPLRSIAIVDADPQSQYLSPEFRLFERLFQRNGIAAVVADPLEMELRGDGLWYRDLEVDLVYNRLTDFSLNEPSNAVLREAYLSGRVVLTPHPHAHALYADKRNLTLLCDDALLRSWRVPDSIRAVLRSGLPRTTLVTSGNAESLWAGRKRLFFKPSAGYGGKGAYRGDKLTRRVWHEILAAHYVAQEYVPPGQRRLRIDSEPVTLKVDVRNYVYEGHIQFMAARMYRGQTTNFRTPGGGFATVFEVDDAWSSVLKRVVASGEILAWASPFDLSICGHPISRG